MNDREKILAVAVLLLVVGWGGSHYYGSFTKAVRTRQAAVQTARTKLEAANRRLNDGRTAVKQMHAAEERALPANVEQASSLYKAWLLAKAKEAGLAVTDIKSTPPTSTSTAYKAVSYQLTGSGTLSNVTAMLYEFYRSPQLHQVTHLQLNRPPGAQQMQITMDVEALSLKGAVATDKLPEGDSKRLKLAKLDDYKKSLEERDLVTAYMPPRPPTPPSERREPTAPPKFDDSEYAMFSGTVGSDNGMQAWITVRTTGQSLYLVAGDKVKVGALDGEIVSVESLSLVYKTGDKKYRVALGQSLRKGKEITAHGEAKNENAEIPRKS